MMALAWFTIGFGVCLAIAVFFWPLVDPYLTRHNARDRLLDRLVENWEREDEAPRDPWNW